MVSPIPLPSSFPAHRVAYAQATPLQLAQALTYVRQVLQGHFPTLPEAVWAATLQRVQPALWVEEHSVHLDADELSYLAQQVALSPELPELEPLIHGPRAGYLARKLVHYEDDAIHALAAIEANPHAYDSSVYRLVVSLALGNAVADEVFRATERGPWGRPGGPDREQARATVSERLKKLRRARGEGEFIPC